MPTLRTHKKNGYSVIDNEPINDSSLSWGAKGILIYLLSKPDNWQIRAIDLVKKGKEGKSAVYAKLRELEEAGYLHRERSYNAQGHIFWTSHIYESPSANPHFIQPVTDNRDMVEPSTDYPDTVNRTVVSTDRTSTDSNLLSSLEESNTPPQKSPNKEQEGKTSIKEVSSKEKVSAPRPAAVDVYRSVAFRFPDKTLWPMIDEKIGDKPDKLEFWRQIIFDYIALGWYKGNIKIMLEFFERGEIPTVKQKGNGKIANVKQPDQATIQLHQEVKARLKARGL